MVDVAPVAPDTSANAPVALSGTGGLTSAFQAISNSISGSANDLANAFATGKEAISGSQKASQAEADAKKAIDTENQKGEIKKKADLAGFAAALGANPDAPSFILNTLAQRKIAGEQDLQNRADMIGKKLDVGFLDNPLEWAVNQFTVNGDIASYNVRVASVDRDTKAMQEIMARTSEMGTMLGQIDNGINETRLAAMNAETQAKADQAVANSKMALSKLGLDVLNIRSALDERQFTNTLQLNNAISEQMRLRLAMNADQRADEQEKFNIKVRQWQVDEKKGDILAQGEIVSHINIALGALGQNPISWQQLKNLPDGKEKQFYMGLLSSPDLANGVLGSTPYTALDTANKYVVNGAPGLNQVRTKLTETVANFAANDPTWHSKNPGERDAVGSKIINEATRKELTGIPDEGGVYSPPSLQMTLAIPKVQSLSLTQDLAQIGTADKLYPTKSNDIFTAAINRIESGKSDVKTMAKEISTIYQSVQVDNNTNRQYPKLAIQPMDPKTGYRVNVYNGVSGWGGIKNVDAVNPVAIEGTLMRILIERQAAAARVNAIP